MVLRLLNTKSIIFNHPDGHPQKVSFLHPDYKFNSIMTSIKYHTQLASDLLVHVTNIKENFNIEFEKFVTLPQAILLWSRKILSGHYNCARCQYLVVLKELLKATIIMLCNE